MLLLVTAVFIIFGRTIAADFVLLDDQNLIYGNPHVTGAFPACLITAWQGPYEYMYIPLVYNLWAMLGQASSPAG